MSTIPSNNFYQPQSLEPTAGDQTDVTETYDASQVYNTHNTDGSVGTGPIGDSRGPHGGSSSETRETVGSRASEVITLRRQHTHIRSTHILQCYVSVMERAKYTFIGLWLVIFGLCTWLAVRFALEAQLSLLEAPPNTRARISAQFGQSMETIRDSDYAWMVFTSKDPANPVNFKENPDFRDLDLAIDHYMRTGSLDFDVTNIPNVTFELNQSAAYDGNDSIISYHSYPTLVRYGVTGIAADQYVTQSPKESAAYSVVRVNNSSPIYADNPAYSSCQFINNVLPGVIASIKEKFEAASRSPLGVVINAFALCDFQDAITQEVVHDSTALGISLAVALVLVTFAFAMRTDSFILGCIAPLNLIIINAVTFGIVYLLNFVTDMENTALLIGLMLSLLTSITFTYLVVVQIQDVQQAVSRYGGVLCIRDQVYLVLELVLQSEGRTIFYSTLVLMTAASGFLVYTMDQQAHIRSIPVTALVLSTVSLFVGMNLLPCLFLAFPSMFSRRGFAKWVCCYRCRDNSGLGRSKSQGSSFGNNSEPLTVASSRSHGALSEKEESLTGLNAVEGASPSTGTGFSAAAWYRMVQFCSYVSYKPVAAILLLLVTGGLAFFIERAFFLEYTFDPVSLFPRSSDIAKTITETQALFRGGTPYPYNIIIEYNASKPNTFPVAVSDAETDFTFEIGQEVMSELLTVADTSKDFFVAPFFSYGTSYTAAGIKTCVSVVSNSASSPEAVAKCVIPIEMVDALIGANYAQVTPTAQAYKSLSIQAITSFNPHDEIGQNWYRNADRTLRNFVARNPQLDIAIYLTGGAADSTAYVDYTDKSNREVLFPMAAGIVLVVSALGFFGYITVPLRSTFHVTFTILVAWGMTGMVYGRINALVPFIAFLPMVYMTSFCDFFFVTQVQTFYSFHEYSTQDSIILAGATCNLVFLTIACVCIFLAGLFNSSSEINNQLGFLLIMTSLLHGIFLRQFSIQPAMALLGEMNWFPRNQCLNLRKATVYPSINADGEYQQGATLSDDSQVNSAALRTSYGTTSSRAWSIELTPHGTVDDARSERSVDTRRSRSIDISYLARSETPDALRLSEGVSRVESTTTLDQGSRIGSTR